MEVPSAMPSGSHERSFGEYTNRVICADALEFLRTLPDGIVDCTVTSPPYYRQRDYAGSQQIGWEPGPSDA